VLAGVLPRRPSGASRRLTMVENSGALPDADDHRSLGLPLGGERSEQSQVPLAIVTHRETKLTVREVATDVGIDRDNLRGGQARRDPAHAGEQFHPNPGGCRGLTANVSTDNPSIIQLDREKPPAHVKAATRCGAPAWATGLARAKRPWSHVEDWKRLGTRI